MTIEKVFGLMTAGAVVLSGCGGVGPATSNRVMDEITVRLPNGEVAVLDVIHRRDGVICEELGYGGDIPNSVPELRVIPQKVGLRYILTVAPNPELSTLTRQDKELGKGSLVGREEFKAVLSALEKACATVRQTR